MFKNSSDGWRDPSLVPSPRGQFTIPVWDPATIDYVDWEFLFIDWYEHAGPKFEADLQLRFSVAMQPEKEQGL